MKSVPSAHRARNAPHAKNVHRVKNVPHVKNVHRVRNVPHVKSVHRVKNVLRASHAKTAVATAAKSAFASCANRWTPPRQPNAKSASRVKNV
ncbi:hypothetical protein D3C79_852600 [compost metagenome]